MKKERGSSLTPSSESKDHTPKPTRTTIFLNDVLDHNLDLLALQTGKHKGELIREGIRQVLQQHHYRPDQKASFHVSP